MTQEDAEALAQKYSALVLKRTGLTRATLVCPREKSDMTPCVARDGALAVTLDGGQNAICVGCETSISARAKDEEFCEWREDDDGIWNTSCRQVFAFIDDGPHENKFAFCCYCGKKLEPIGYLAPVVSDE